MTPAQLVTLKAALLAETDPAFVAARTAFATGAMVEWLAQPSPVIVWRTRVAEQEITSQVSAEGTVWSWTTYINRSAAERDGWARMFNGTYTINPSLPQVRAAFADIFSGAAQIAIGQRTHLAAISKRPANRGEKIFVTGTGTLASPGLLGFEGTIGEYDVVVALTQI